MFFTIKGCAGVNYNDQFDFSMDFLQHQIRIKCPLFHGVFPHAQPSMRNHGIKYSWCRGIRAGVFLILVYENKHILDKNEKSKKKHADKESLT